MKNAYMAVTLAIGLCATAPAQLLLVGSEFQVNTFTPSEQYAAAVAGSATGFVVVWSGGGVGDDGGIFGQRFTSLGSRLGGEFMVNSYTPVQQVAPSIAMDETGFVVSWMAFNHDGGGTGVFARRFGSNGSAIGSEFQVHTFTIGDQANSSVGMSSGSFVIVWHAPGDYYPRGIRGQRFTSAGDPFSVEFDINAYIQGDQKRPWIAMDAQGFVVVWESEGQDGSNDGVFGRRFGSSGVAVGEDFQINSYTIGYQSGPSVTKDGTGFVVVWRAPDGILGEIAARRYSSSGVALASEFRANSDISAFDSSPSVALNNGSFVAAWASPIGLASSIRGRGFDGQSASPLGDLQVNQYSAEPQYRPRVARSGPGFVVVWDVEQDGSGRGIFARRLRQSADLDVDGNGVVEPLTDTLLALRYAFGFRGATLITGAVALDCTRCDAPSIEAFLAGKV